MTAIITTESLHERVGPEKLVRASELLRASAHPQRLDILDALSQHARLCNRELEGILGIEQAILSQHLTLMRDKGLLSCEKEGKYTYWSLKLTEFMKIVSCLENCCEQL
ncbi:MAG: winged helix-turn-helix transcriptional regulator [Flavobacteriales bacterium]|jgi:DNA-binding transcriptional ArsR family regulator|nr:winged helix-turn-helix transcriptional regulator [Flavobacteriales bacterium]